jgi:hypothetical protein
MSSLSSRNSSLSRSQSKTSLRSFFSRGRSGSSTSQCPDTSTSRGRTATVSGKHSRHSSCNVARAESPHLSQIGSRLDSYRPTQATHAAHIERARSKQHRARLSWDPPPLFQAYPQSLKHALLDASCLSTNVILRKSPYRDGRTPDDLAKAEPIDSQSMGAPLNKAKEGSNKHARKLSASISSSGWTKHVFVLVDSGYLLQYAGGGHHDRLPEKMMQLRKDTVAFASDAIPGRHWVLQVSQIAGEDTITKSESSKGILSRIGLQSAESRRSTQNFLMVFDNAEDLDSWLTTIRREVEALGGRQCRPRTPTDGEDRYLRSHRTVQGVSGSTDPHQFPAAPYRVLSPVRPEFPEVDRGHVEDSRLEFRFWDHGTTSQQRSEDSSTITSTDLDRLRNSKDSGGSTDTGTSTSFHRPVPSSPGCEAYALKSIPSLKSVDASIELHSQLRAAQIQDSTSVEAHSPTFLCHALDAVDIEGGPHRETNTGPSNAGKLPIMTPNFSVPVSSNRFSFFGSSEALNTGASQGTTATNSPIPENDSFDDDSAENDSFSRRPVSIISPLPTPEALMNPTGTRIRTLRHPSTEKPLPLQPVLAYQHPTSSLGNHDDASSSMHRPTTIPKSFSSLEHAMSILSAPLPTPKKELPALPRSISYQGLSTFYNSGNASASITLPVPPSRGQSQQRPISLSGFPEPPSSARPIAPSPANTEAPDPSMHVKPLALSGVKSLPTMTITGAPVGFNSRLSRIRDSRGLPTLGVIPPSGPPPNCPLPATPSPRKRRYRPRSKPNSCSEQSRVTVRPPSRTSSTKVATQEN